MTEVTELIKPGRTNLKDLVLSTEQPFQPMDPVDLVTPGDWRKLLNIYENPDWILTNLLDIQILNPNIRKEIEMSQVLEGAIQKELKETKEYVKESLKGGDSHNILANLGHIKAADPAQFHRFIDEIGAGTLDVLSTKVFEELHGLRNSYEVDFFSPPAYPAGLLCFVSPKERDHFANDPLLQDFFKKRLDYLSSKPASTGDFNFLNELKHLKFSFPDVANAHPIPEEFLQVSWESFHSYLERLRNGDKKSYQGFYNYSTNLRVALAKEANVTDDGVELIMPTFAKKVDASTLPVPKKY